MNFPVQCHLYLLMFIDIIHFTSPNPSLMIQRVKMINYGGVCVLRAGWQKLHTTSCMDLHISVEDGGYIEI
jgi:hypothetical protein